MKFTALVLLLLNAFIHAATAQNQILTLPSCAVNCMDTYIPQSSCSATDQHCICVNKGLNDLVTECVQANCTVKQALTTQKYTAAVCDWPVHDKQPLIRDLAISFFIVATIFYAGRMLARFPIFGGEFGADDYMITLGWLFAFALTTLTVLLASAGLGKDIWQVPFTQPNDQITYTLKLFTGYEKTYILTTWFTKASVLFLYLRIFPDANFRTNVRLALAFCAAAAFCLFWACLFKCWPISYGWTYWDGEHHGSCSNQNAQGWSNAGLNIFGDLLVILLPLPTIWKMSLPRGKRWAITFMFGVGICITMVSLARLYSLRAYSLNNNPTWDFVNITIWSFVEVDVSIICACLPGTRNFYNRVICGRILDKGRFSRGASMSRVGSPCYQHKEIQHNIDPEDAKRSVSMASVASDTTTLGHNDTAVVGVAEVKKFVIIVNDIDFDSEERSMSARPLMRLERGSGVWRVEESPIRAPGQVAIRHTQ